jgi:Uma2 family endonuclease
VVGDAHPTGNRCKSVFIYRPKQEIEVFDELEVILPVPEFAIDLQLTIKDLFAYLLK